MQHIATCNNPDTESDRQSIERSPPILSSASSSSEMMHERRARTGPCKQALAAPSSSDKDCQAPPAAAHDHQPAAPQPTCDQTNNCKQQQMLQYFCTERQSGLDEEHRARIESDVQAYIIEAKADHLPHQPLCAPINEAGLRTAQRNLYAASGHGKDKVRTRR